MIKDVVNLVLETAIGLYVPGKKKESGMADKPKVGFFKKMGQVFWGIMLLALLGLATWGFLNIFVFSSSVQTSAPQQGVISRLPVPTVTAPPQTGKRCPSAETPREVRLSDGSTITVCD